MEVLCYFIRLYVCLFICLFVCLSIFLIVCWFFWSCILEQQRWKSTNTTRRCWDVCVCFNIYPNKSKVMGNTIGTHEAFETLNIILLCSHIQYIQHQLNEPNKLNAPPYPIWRFWSIFSKVTSNRKHHNILS